MASSSTDEPGHESEDMREIALESVSHFLASSLAKDNESATEAAEHMRAAQSKLLRTLSECHKTIEEGAEVPAEGTTKALRDRMDQVTAKAKRVGQILGRIDSKLKYLEQRYGVPAASAAGAAPQGSAQGTAGETSVSEAAAAPAGSGAGAAAPKEKEASGST